MNGWFAVKHGITKHPLFQGHPERLAIWLWLLDNACHKDTPHDINGKTVIVPRGAVAASERRIAKEVGVGYQVVRTFLGRLRSEHMVNARLTQGRNVISLCNYEKYQQSEKGANAGGNARLTHDQRTKEQVNNSVLRTGPSVPDPSQVIFTDCLAVLKDAGVSDRNGRSMLGKWRKIHGDSAVIAATGKAKREGAINPIEFIEGVFRHQSKPAPQSSVSRIAAKYLGGD